MDWTDYALPLIRKWEGLRLSAYLCPAGVPTIGYGTTGPEVRIGMTWTKAQAEAALLSDVKEFARDVKGMVKVPVSPQQFAALVSLAYNIGTGALRGSTLLRLLNAGDYTGAGRQFDRWSRAGGRVLPGLQKRRAEERRLFDTGA